MDRFADFMVKDVKNGECFRLDHLIKNVLEKLASEKTTSPETKAECEDIVIKVKIYLKMYIIILTLRHVLLRGFLLYWSFSVSHPYNFDP